MYGLVRLHNMCIDFNKIAVCFCCHGQLLGRFQECQSGDHGGLALQLLMSDVTYSTVQKENTWAIVYIDRSTKCMRSFMVSVH